MVSLLILGVEDSNVVESRINDKDEPAQRPVLAGRWIGIKLQQ